MTGCVESSVSQLQAELDRLIEAKAPAVENLLHRVAPEEEVSAGFEGSEFRAEVPLRFPDGIGEGRVVARLFRYHDTVRLDIYIDHNRVMAKPDGSPSDRRCFLNDYKASVSFRPGQEEFPENFEQRVLEGIWKARDAVQNYNRRHPEPWHHIRVTAAPREQLAGRGAE
ncbi:MAG: hypothetical protein KatS3mg081_2724 [Gemmatimonadales bacterium]|nr:MAG: hypothetical protein KatS3mg081_2724 [Gemmatimonadales bacterium]